MASQRDETGWRTITVPDAENATVSHKAFFDNDKSRKQIRTEILSKKAANVLREMYPDERIHVRRQEGKLVLDGVKASKAHTGPLGVTEHLFHTRCFFHCMGHCCNNIRPRLVDTKPTDHHSPQSLLLLV